MWLAKNSLSLDLALMPKTLLPTVAGCTVGLFPSNSNSGALLVFLFNAFPFAR